MGVELRRLGLRSIKDLIEDVGEDASTEVIVDFGRGIETGDEGKAQAAAGSEGDFLHGLELAGESGDAKGAGVHVLDLIVVLFVLKVKGEDAHADEVGAVDALEAFGDDGLDAEEGGTFGCPVTGGSHAVVFATDDDEFTAGLLVGDGGVVNEGGLGAFGGGDFLIRGGDGGVAEVLGVAALDAGGHEVLDADVTEGAAGHDAVVSATGTEGVELGFFDTVFEEVFSGGTGFGDGSGGGDVVGGDTVPEDAEGAGVDDVPTFSGGGAGEVVEEGWELNVGGVVIPLVGVAGGDFDLDPLLIGGVEIGVELVEDFRFEGGADDFLEFLRGRPEVFEINVSTMGILTKRVIGEVDVNATCEGVGNDKRRGHEEIRTNGTVNAGFEIAVAGEDGGADKITLVNGFLDGGVEWSGVADAGGTAVADGLEPELIEFLLKVGGFKVIGDDPRTRSEGGLNVRGDSEAAFVGFFGHQTGGEHDRGVAGVGATGDGRNEDGAVPELGVDGIEGFRSGNFGGGRAVGDHFDLVLVRSGLGVIEERANGDTGGLGHVNIDHFTA